MQKKWMLVIISLLVLALMVVGCQKGSSSGQGEAGGNDGNKVANAVPLSNETKKCIGCHKGSTVGVHKDWQASKHSQKGVGCYECHQARAGDKDAVDHNGFKISYLVTPKDCGQCHAKQVDQFGKSLHAQAVTFVKAVPGVSDDDDFLGYKVEGPAASVRACEQCHGTIVKVDQDGRPTAETWPNSGIGRINPDGSKGNCTPCHTSHKFSLAESRKPDSCGYCHLGPDHPQMDIYWESAHGTVYKAEGASWKWDAPENQWGRDDFRTPTCAVCHMSGLNGVYATHNVSERLSWELEKPLSEHTKNWEHERGKMQKICQTCHSEEWVSNFYKQADASVVLYNEEYYKPLTKLMNDLQTQNLLSAEKFDEEFDFKYFEMWHHEGRRARFGAFMNGPDYVQWHGFYELAKDRVELRTMAEDLRKEGKARDVIDYKPSAQGGGAAK